MSTPLYTIETFQVTTTPHSTNLVGLAPMATEPCVTVTMPLPVAKELCLILRKQLLDREQRQGAEIVISQEVYQAMGIPPEDWKKWLG